MLDIAKIDPNFKTDGKVTKDGLDVYDVTHAPFCVYGMMQNRDRPFVRLPYETALTVNDGVARLFRHTAGGRIRFRTNSRRLVLHACMEQIVRISHFALSGSSGFDLYFSDENTPFRYYTSFIPPLNIANGYEAERDFEDQKEREILIHFPTYSSVEQLEIGLDAGASLSAASKYAISVPVVYYGSSITQGGCCSRPGNTYPSVISRRLDCDHINLGFSGSALGEQTMANYIASLNMSAFVLDFDYNAPTVEYLASKHYSFYQTVRKAHAHLPILFVSRPQAYPNNDDLRRREIIWTSYAKGIAEGDKNLTFIDGIALMQGGGEEGLVDGCHPTDLGFSCMAKGIGDALAYYLK